MQKFILVVILISVVSLKLYAEETLFNVSTLNQYNLKNNLIVTFDYNQNSVAELFTYNVQNRTKEDIPLYGNEEPYFLLTGFNGNEIVYVNFNTSNNYYIDYYNLETSASERLITDGAYKEFIWCSEDKIVWIDYRNAGGNSSNSEVYMYDLVTSEETRVTNDTYYQSKSVTDGKHIVWVEYRNDLYGNIVIYDIKSGQREFIQPVNYHQDNPRIYGNYVVWEDYLYAYTDSGNVDTYVYNIKTNQINTISNAPGFQGNPNIFKDLVVFEDSRIDSNYSLINTYDIIDEKISPLTTKEQFDIWPQIDNNVITFVRQGNNHISFMKIEKYINDVISDQPLDVIQCEGTDVIFDINIIDDLNQTEREISWYNDADRLSESNKFRGVNSTSLTISNIGQNDAGEYHAEVKAILDGSIFISDSAELIVNFGPNILSQPEDTLEISLDEKVVLDIDVKGTDPIGYQWYKDDNILDGENERNLIIFNISESDVGDYHCKITNDCNSIISNRYHLKLLKNVDPPTITIQPDDHYALTQGDELSIAIEATGTPELKYEWYRNNSLMSDDISSIYHRESVDKEDEGQYFCIVKNEYGSAYSDTTDVSILVGVDNDIRSDSNIIAHVSPNPFSESTTISFQLLEPGWVLLEIYDKLGNKVVTEVNEFKNAGEHQSVFNGINLTSGIYFYLLQTETTKQSGKIVLVR